MAANSHLLINIYRIYVSRPFQWIAVIRRPGRSRRRAFQADLPDRRRRGDNRIPAIYVVPRDDKAAPRTQIKEMKTWLKIGRN
jgi:hypothetical protein